ncbi:MAG: Rpp14/Pop5 family protein [Methanocellales archaeon]|nr:Rpp14/Pop5 family protein [Methanocellales archaeon]
MKRLPPSLRKRRRYLAFEVMSTGEIGRDDFINELRAASQSLLGDVGVSQCDLWLIDFDGTRGILRCARDKTTLARAVLATINKVGMVSVGVRALGISGTIKGVTEKFIERRGISKMD